MRLDITRCAVVVVAGALAVCAGAPIAQAQDRAPRFPDRILEAEPAPLPEGFRRGATGDAAWRGQVEALHSARTPFDANWRKPERPTLGADIVRVGRNVVVMEDTDNVVFNSGFTGIEGNRALARITDQLYANYPDEYDFVQILIDWSERGVFAYYMPLANDVRGIGWQNTPPYEDLYDQTEGPLQGLIFMNNWRFYMGAQANLGRVVFLQEIGHRWGAFVRYDKGEGEGALDELLGRDRAHWSYFMSSHNSALEGNDWQDNLDGSFTSLTSGARMTFSSLDLYLMGVLPQDEVEPWYVLREPEIGNARDANGARLNPASPPEIEGNIRTIRARREDITIRDVIRAEGPRRPDHADSQKVWRMATVLIVQPGSELSDEDFEQVELLIDTWRVMFEDETGGVLDLITALDGQEAAVNRPLGEACDDAAQCDPAQATTCLAVESGGQVCSKRCVADAECGAGFCCGETDGGRFCHPDTEQVCQAEPEPEPEPGTNNSASPDPEPGQTTGDETPTTPNVGTTNADDGGCAVAGRHAPAGAPGLALLGVLGLAAAVRRRRMRA